jgi:RNA polymerase sigma factor (sigma-70 family)
MRVTGKAAVPLERSQVVAASSSDASTRHGVHTGGPVPDVVGEPAFDIAFRDEFDRRYTPLARYLARLVGDGALAADLAQEAFVRLFRRGAMPDEPGAWLVSVAHNLLRNERRQARRRMELIGARAAEVVPSDAAVSPDAAVEMDETREHVRRALDTLAERERRMLLLRYEGFSYQEIAAALQLHPASVGTLLARAKAAFRRALGEGTREGKEEGSHAPE